MCYILSIHEKDWADEAYFSKNNIYLPQSALNLHYLPRVTYIYIYDMGDHASKMDATAM